MAFFNTPAARLQLAKVTAVFSFLTSLPIASATYTIARCCTLAVRTEYQKYYDDKFPWVVCNFNIDINYSTKETFVSITKPLWWVKEFCPGMQLSDTSQWLQPLATYISPYIGLLLLCPMGETEQDEKTKKKPWASLFRAVVATLKELVSILGDPASAISGAASEIYADTVALWGISSLPAEKQRPRWVAALAGALKFSSKTDWRRRQSANESEPFLKDTTSNNELPSEAITQPYVDPSGEETARAISICISARASFTSTILIPVVLMLAVTAATFYDAYANKGDKDTGLALAYCIWYSWILVPAVAGNCFATVLSPDLARRAFHKVLYFDRGEKVIVALRDRHVNNQFWGNWLRRQDQEHHHLGFKEFRQELGRDFWFWVRLLAWNMLGWCVVAVAGAAGAAVAWTTPTVGLGCRSFNVILYGILAFVNAGLQVLYSWLTVRNSDKLEGKREKQVGMVSKLTAVGVVQAVYWFLVCVNALVVVVLGTIFHLVGLNGKTAEAYQSAQKYWISTAYVVFSIMTLICLLGVVFRQVISRRMDEWTAREEGDRKVKV
ncbi:hypothetical protein QBC37DRAFT_451196 [Rhypophila decipiens]|uniref:Uncharacterized protein n=1 Tax=Rhypophila decipiens TaxID=261697 RepID=A0AAN6Y4A7_9PEZI|nr:hypothetical protein QBC37DRAFT_451196 [Rhypophila decipiens]